MYAAADCDIMSDAGTQYDIVGSLSYAQEVTVNGKVEAGEDALWYVIKTEDGSTQMVRADMLSGTKPAVQTASGSGSGSNSGGGTGDAGGTGNSQTASTTTPAPAEPVATPAPEPAATPEPAPADPVVSPAPTPEPAPVHTHSWNAHYVETQVWVPNVVWVPNIVVVEDYETQTTSYKNYICNCGFETTDNDVRKEHCKAHVFANEPDNFWWENITNEQQVLVGTHEEDQGHYETSTYVDYYYCEGCGAIQ